MNTICRFLHRWPLAALALAGPAPAALACAVCNGGPESAQAEGMNYAILFLLGVSGSVVTGLGVVASRIVGAERCPDPVAPPPSEPRG